MSLWNFDKVQQEARSHWHEILGSLGIAVPSNPKEHAPCPACGGKDRFRFDDQGGDGTWFCNQCVPHAGDGFQLVRNVQRCTFPQALEKVATTLGLSGRADCKLGNSRVTARSAPPEGTLGRDLFAYEDESGRTVLYVHRTEVADRKRFGQWGPTADGQGWQNTTEHVPKSRPLYRLVAVLNSPSVEPVIFHEGEKCVHAALEANLPGTHTTTVGGAGNPRQSNFSPLRGREVFIIPDQDKPGLVYADTVASLAINAGARTVGIVRLPDLQDKGDVVDWLKAGGTAEHFIQLLAQAERWTPQGRIVKRQSGEQEVSGASESAPPKGSQSDSSLLVELAKEDETEFFHEVDRVGYATIRVEDHLEHWPLNSKQFRWWLSQKYFEQRGRVPRSAVLQDALAVLEGVALFSGPTSPVSLRLGEHDGRIYVDLCNPDWTVVEISSEGWQVMSSQVCPIKFRRMKGMLPLPNPAPGGTLEELVPFLNLDTERPDDWTLIAAWLLAAYRPSGPFPLLVLNGEQGSGKTSLQRLLRSLTDPYVSPCRAEPREPRDLMITAHNSWILAFDNLSGLSPWLSDALCRLSTGGGFATRTLYSDSEETIFECQRPVILNGIEEIATRADLLDRSLCVQLPPISDDRRATEASIKARFEAIRPRILGAMYEVVADALREMPFISLTHLPRMADLATWVTAAEQSLGWEKGRFLEALRRNRELTRDVSLEASAVLPVLSTLLKTTPVWEGSASELLQALNRTTEPWETHQQGWPKTPRALANHLRRLSPNLRAAGVTVTYTRDSSTHVRKRLIRIEQKNMVASNASDSSDSSNLFKLPAGAQPKSDDHLSDASQRETPPSDIRTHEKCRLDSVSGGPDVSSDESDQPDARERPFLSPNCDLFSDEINLED